MQEVNNGKKVFDIAHELGFSSYKLAKMVTRHLYGDAFQVLDVASDAALVRSEALRADLIRCCTEDCMSSHKADLMKRVVGERALAASHLCVCCRSNSGKMRLRSQDRSMKRCCTRSCGASTCASRRRKSCGKRESPRLQVIY